MTGTNQSQVSFPIKVYNAIGKFGNFGGLSFDRMHILWHLTEVSLAVRHVCVCTHVCMCNYMCGCVVVSLQLFLLLQQPLHRLYTLGQQTTYQSIHLMEGMPHVGCVWGQYCMFVCLFVCLFVYLFV